MPYKDIEQKRKYAREWLANRRSDWFSDKRCVRCSSTENLELDHIDRSTKKDHKIWSWSKERFDEEIVKCQVLCKQCHHLKSWLESRGPDHGIGQRYRQGCRCAPCKEVQSKRLKDYRLRIKNRKSI